MRSHIVAVPREEDLKLLNNLRDYIYHNDYRFKNKPLSSDTHLTLAEIELDEDRVPELKRKLSREISEMPFTLTEDEWILTKEDKEANYKVNKPYTWIALKFPQRKNLYQEIDILTAEMDINRNKGYIENVKRIESNSGEYIGNHINLANYTRRDKANECWEYFNSKLPKKIVFYTLALIGLRGRYIFEIKY